MRLMVERICMCNREGIEAVTCTQVRKEKIYDESIDSGQRRA